MDTTACIEILRRTWGAHVWVACMNHLLGDVVREEIELISSQYPDSRPRSRAVGIHIMKGETETFSRQHI